MSAGEVSKDFWKIDWGRQGGVVFSYFIVFIGYYGIIVNFMMVAPNQDWISYLDMDIKILFWEYQYFMACYFLPVLLLYLINFRLNYKEDIFHYGIRASLWLVPFIKCVGFMFYFIMFGFSAEPFILQFGSIEGYINLIILVVVNLLGAISGITLKKYITSRRKTKILEKIDARYEKTI